MNKKYFCGIVQITSFIHENPIQKRVSAGHTAETLF